MKHIRAALALVVGTLAITAYALTPVPIRLTNFRPTTGFEPLTVHGLLVIEPDASNRSVCLVATGDDYATQSCGDVDGINEKKSREITLKLPAGEYRISAMLYQSNGKLIPANVVQITVLSRTGAPSSGTRENYVARRAGS